MKEQQKGNRREMAKDNVVLEKRDGRIFILGKNNQYKPTKAQEVDCLEFALKNKCVINPKGMDSALRDFNEFKHCVCDPNRPTCPCAEAPQEIKEKGHCKCHLFWSGYTTYMRFKNLETCEQGGDHDWADGHCKKCFVSKVGD